MHDVRLHRVEKAGEGAESREIGGVRIALDRRHDDAEAAGFGDAGDGVTDALLIAARIEEQADLMTPRRLLDAEVDHMAKQAAQRGAKHMNDPKRARTRQRTQLRTGAGSFRRRSGFNAFS